MRRDTEAPEVGFSQSYFFAFLHKKLQCFWRAFKDVEPSVELNISKTGLQMSFALYFCCHFDMFSLITTKMLLCD
jgi:hypothetical protein